MSITTKTTTESTFLKEVREGLSSYPKYLSSKFIYDKRGDELFQQIMKMPEYYLTRCEHEILSTYTAEISNFFIDPSGFDLIELGAGDGAKTKIILEYLQSIEVEFTYKPIDISENAINNLTKNLKVEFPNVSVSGERGEYFEVLERLKDYKTRKKVIMVLGSNIGNLLHPKAITFLSKLKDAMDENDLLFIGFDQKKDPAIVLEAYNDQAGITEAFNKNLLTRINHELGGNFDPNKFKHWELYNPETGTAKSFLVAKERMQVRIDALDMEFSFKPWETIHTEISQKYDDEIVAWLAGEAGMKIITSFSDENKLYKNYLFKTVN